jgi:adenylate cyclase
MAVPIMHQEDLLGIMLIDSSVAVNAYTEKDLHLLSNIANQTAQFIKNAQMAIKIETGATTRERFQRLLSPDLAELVVSGELSVEKGGENRVATVLFADIRGFTAMSEDMVAAEVLSMLNEYFEVMVEIVFRHEGTVDKFVGDEIMVIWGAPVNHEDDAARAVRAALDMQAALEDFNKGREANGLLPIHIGIGINTGDLVAGYIGSTRTMSYSVIGDVVNTAARICSAAKAGQTIIAEATSDFVKDEFELAAVEPLLAKGKSKPISAFTVLGSKQPYSNDDTAARPTKSQT